MSITFQNFDTNMTRHRVKNSKHENDTNSRVNSRVILQRDFVSLHGHIKLENDGCE